MLKKRQQEKKRVLDSIKKFRKGQMDESDFLDDLEGPSKAGQKNVAKGGDKGGAPR